jgi:hypothetical protein
VKALRVAALVVGGVLSLGLLDAAMDPGDIRIAVGYRFGAATGILLSLSGPFLAAWGFFGLRRGIKNAMKHF